MSTASGNKIDPEHQYQIKYYSMQYTLHSTYSEDRQLRQKKALTKPSLYLVIMYAVLLPPKASGTKIGSNFENLQETLRFHQVFEFSN